MSGRRLDKAVLPAALRNCWRELAHSYEFAERLADFLSGPPPPSHPRCATCAVPMWLVNIERFSCGSQRDRGHYQCKVCNATPVLGPVTEP